MNEEARAYVSQNRVGKRARAAWGRLGGGRQCQAEEAEVGGRAGGWAGRFLPFLLGLLDERLEGGAELLGLEFGGQLDVECSGVEDE